MKTSSKAIVIKRKKVSGADVLLTVITRDYGKKTLYVNGARHMKSKLSSATQLFVEGDFSLYIKSSLSTLSEAELIEVHANIREDLDKFFVGSYIVELVDKILGEDDGDPRFFDFLSSALKYLNLEDRSKLKLFRLVFLIKLLKNTGYSPNVKFCSSCSSDLDFSKPVYFSPISGGVICPICLPQFSDKVILRPETLSFINVSLEKSYTSIRKLGVGVNILVETDEVLSLFFKEHVNLSKLKSEKILLDMGL